MSVKWTGLDMIFFRAEFDGHIDLALEVFKINSFLFPKSFNVYDSNGEVLLHSGKKDQAIIMYKKSLSINPNNIKAKEILKNEITTKE